MSFNSSLSPNVVKTDLDKVFFQEFEKSPMKNYVDATSPMIFNQATAENSAVQIETFGGIGAWPTRGEEANVFSASPRVTNKATYSVSAFASSVDVPKHFFDDNLHGSYEMMVRNFADMARVTRDKNAFKHIAQGFATTQTSDGAYIFSNTHTTISGDTVDNLDTAVLTSTSLWNALSALLVQKDHAGEVRGKMGNVLLVPPALYKTACELAEAELRPNTGNNEPNVFLTKFGIYVACSPYLSAAASGVSGADTAWYILSDKHSLSRFVRTGVETDLVPYQYQRNNVYIYKGEFREVIGCPDYVGLYASTGTV